MYYIKNMYSTHKGGKERKKALVFKASIIAFSIPVLSPLRSQTNFTETSKLKAMKHFKCMLSGSIY